MGFERGSISFWGCAGVRREAALVRVNGAVGLLTFNWRLHRFCSRAQSLVGAGILAKLDNNIPLMSYKYTIRIISIGGNPNQRIRESRIQSPANDAPGGPGERKESAKDPEAEHIETSADLVCLRLPKTKTTGLHSSAPCIESTVPPGLAEVDSAAHPIVASTQERKGAILQNMMMP